MGSPASCRSAAAKLGGADEEEDGPPVEADTDGVAEELEEVDADEDDTGSPVYRLSSWLVSVSNMWLTWSLSRELSLSDDPREW